MELSKTKICQSQVLTLNLELKLALDGQKLLLENVSKEKEELELKVESVERAAKVQAELEKLKFAEKIKESLAILRSAFESAANQLEDVSGN